MNILVSHCFLGEPCRYDGQSRLDRQVIELHRAGHNLIPVCPELLGGLDIPRSPAEIQPDGRVLTQDGQDVTAAYRAGAERALEIAKEHGCTVAVLKARSPSCGSGVLSDNRILPLGAFSDKDRERLCKVAFLRVSGGLFSDSNKI